MSSNGFEQPLRIEIGRSRHCALFLILVHTAALASLLWLQLPGLVRLTLALLLFFSLTQAMSLHALRSHKRAIERLWTRADGRLFIQLRDGTEHDVRRQPGAWLTPALVVQRLGANSALQGRVRLAPLVLFADAMNAEDFRRLRVFLAWAKAVKPGL